MTCQIVMSYRGGPTRDAGRRDMPVFPASRLSLRSVQRWDAIVVIFTGKDAVLLMLCVRSFSLLGQASVPATGLNL